MTGGGGSREIRWGKSPWMRQEGKEEREGIKGVRQVD